MSAVGRSCANTIKRSRQNVAIATQVLSPSAIGGSLRDSRKLKHFGPPDDDEEEFISYRRRAACKKLSYYGAAIVVTILILMGTILAVGFLQTKSNSSNNAVVSRSVKLIQEGKPFSYIYSSKTTPYPPSLEPTHSQEFAPTSHSSFLRSYTNADPSSVKDTNNYQNDDIYFSTSRESEQSDTVGENDNNNDYLVDVYNMEADNNDHTEVGRTNDNGNDYHKPFLVNSHPTSNSTIENKGEDDDDDESYPSSHKLDNDLDTVTDQKESVHNDINGNNDNNEKLKGIVVGTTTDEEVEYTKENNEDELPTERKALPPPSSSVFSLEIPIYSQNKTNYGSIDSSAQNDDFIEDPDPKEHIESLGTTRENVDRNAQNMVPKESINDKKEGTEDIKRNYNKNVDESVENERFHQSLLHTALFHLDEEQNTKPKPVSTAIIIEDLDSEDSTGYVENFESDHALTNRNRTRNHTVKILKNDRVMNMKATYAPEGLKSPFQDKSTNEETIDVFAEKNTEHKPNVKAKNINQNGTRNEVANNEWKLRLRVNKDKSYKSRLDNANKYALSEEKYDSTHQDEASSNEQRLTSSSVNQKYSVGEPGGLFEEKPRSLSMSSMLPNFESFLKAIFTNVQQASGKKGDVSLKERPISMSPSDYGASYVNSLDHLLPASTLPSPSLEQDPSIFRKRTIISEHDIFDFTPPIQRSNQPHAENYFDHLLGPIPTIGAIGSLPTTGASFNNFQFKSQLYPIVSTISNSPYYDINHSSTSDTPQLAPGVVPLNLASSYIPVGQPKSQYSGQQIHQTQFSPYATHNLYDNFGDPSSFSFNNVLSKPGNNAGLNVGTLTTSNGEAPTYNSISQGMHLLNLISGTIPSTYYHDQVYQSTTPPAFHNEALTSTPSFHFNGPTTTNNYGAPSNPHEFHNQIGINSQRGSPPPPPPPRPAFSSQSFDYHPESSSSNGRIGYRQPSLDLPLIARALALKSDREALEKFLEDEDSDQVPAASSFSQNILTTFRNPKEEKKSATKHEEPTTTSASIVTLMTKPRTRTTSMFKASPIPATNSATPKSFSFEILPHKNSSPHDYQKSSVNTADNDSNALSLANQDLYPSLDLASTSRSKKKSGADLNKSRNVFSYPIYHHHNSEMTLTTSNNIPFGDKNASIKSSTIKLSSKTMRNEKKARKAATNAVGLKSGFFT